MPLPVNVLVIDDDEEDFIITRDIIKDISIRKYNVDWVPSFHKALELMEQNLHDIYLIDYRLGPDSGLDLIKTITDKGYKVPVILLTGQGDIDIDEQAMNAGASDYLIKGKLNSYDLEKAIRYSIQNSKNIKEIQDLNKELEERVQKRTSELFKAMKELEVLYKKQINSEKEVRKALEKEKELNELKSRFVTIASHEFKTPLTTILSSAALISRHSQVNDVQKIETNIQRIKSSVNNLTGILNDFLSLSKLEEGVIPNNPCEFSLKQLIEDIKNEIHPLLKEDQHVVLSYSGVENIFLDKQVMKNILINLVSNAIKYSEKGNIEINAKLSMSAITISVKDEGIGIPEEDKSFLFNRFFRSKNAGNISGTGLGLNIVKRYVEILKGNLDFISELGKGSTFTLIIPNQFNV